MNYIYFYRKLMSQAVVLNHQSIAELRETRNPPLKLKKYQKNVEGKQKNPRLQDTRNKKPTKPILQPK